MSIFIKKNRCIILKIWFFLWRTGMHFMILDIGFCLKSINFSQIFIPLTLTLSLLVFVPLTLTLPPSLVWILPKSFHKPLFQKHFTPNPCSKWFFHSTLKRWFDDFQAIPFDFFFPFNSQILLFCFPIYFLSCDFKNLFIEVLNSFFSNFILLIIYVKCTNTM